MATRAADDFDAIRDRLTELRRADALGRAAAVEAAKAAFPCPVPAAPKVQDPPAEHVVVGWEEPANGAASPDAAKLQARAALYDELMRSTRKAFSRELKEYEAAVAEYNARARADVDRKMVGNYDGRVVNPALEEVFARMRGYLDDTMGQRPAEPLVAEQIDVLPAPRRIVQEYLACPGLAELLTKAKRLPPKGVPVVEDGPDGPTFRGIAIRLPPPPDLGAVGYRDVHGILSDRPLSARMRQKVIDHAKLNGGTTR